VLSSPTTTLRLANASGTTPRIRDFHPLEKYTRLKHCLTKNICIFAFFHLLCSRCALPMQGAHKIYMSIAVSVLTTSRVARNSGGAARQENRPQSATAYSSVRYMQFEEQTQ
jgi:hypothetical protein